MKIFWDSIIKGLGIGVSTIFIALIVVALGYFFFFKNNQFCGKYIFNSITSAQCTTTEKQVIANLVHQDKLLAVNDVMRDRMSFYETIITFLVAILGLVGFLSFIYIKTLSVETAKAHIDKSVSEFFHHDEFNDKLNAKLDDAIENVNLEKNAEMVNLNKMIARLDERIEVLESSTIVENADDLEVNNGGIEG